MPSEFHSLSVFTAPENLHELTLEQRRETIKPLGAHGKRAFPTGRWAKVGQDVVEIRLLDK